MKKSLSTSIALFGMAAMTLFSVASCGKIEDIKNPEEGTQMTIVAALSETKTVNQGMSTAWASGDQLSVVHNTTGQSTAYNDRFTYQSGNSFNGNAQSLGQKNDWYVIYPYTSSISKASEVPVSVNATPSQNGVNSSAHLAGAGFPLFGKNLSVASSAQPLDISLKNGLSVAKFVVTNTLSVPVIVSSIELTSVSAIAGEFTVDLTADTPEWKAKNASTKLTLSVSGDATIAAGQQGTFYAGIAPHELPAGSEILVVVRAERAGASEVPCNVTKTITTATAFQAGLQKAINVDYDETHQDGPTPSTKGYQLVTSEPSDWSGSYLIVDVNKAKVFTGKTDQSNYYTLKPSDIEGNVITSSSLSQYAFTITKNGNNFYLKQGNNYYSVNWNSNSSTGIVTSTSQTAISYGGVLSNGAFLFYGVDSSDSNKNKYLYVKSGEAYFKFGESGGKTGILLYKYSDGSTPDVPPTPSTDKTYKKVTSFTSGKHYVIAEGTNALKNNNGNIASASINGKVSGNILTLTSSEAASLEWTATSSSVKSSQGEFTLNNGSSYLSRVTSTNAAQLAAYDSGSAGYFVWFLSGTGNNLYNVNSTGQYTFYLDYNNGWTANQQNATNAIVVYEEDGSTPATKQDQNLSFTKSSKTINSDTFTLGSGTYIAPTLIGAMTTPVTWTSSKTSVATVSNDGTVTIVAAGTTTITASAPASDTYNEASASYELTVSPAQGQPTTKTYTKVTSLQSGKKYVIVHSGHALQNNNGNPAAYSVTASGNTLTVSADVAATLEWTATSEPASTATGHFSLSNSGKYAARTGGNNNTFGFESSVGAKSVWDLDNAGNDLYHKNSTGQYTFYLTYSNGWSVNSTSEGNSIAVYVEDGGSTPDVPPTPPTPSGERTYTKVNNISEGTYLICGSENDGTYVCLFPPVTAKNSSIGTSNRCEELKFSTNNITEITTDNASIIGSEVTITKSGNNWLVQYNGQYMYYNNGAIAFTSTASSAAQSISLSSGKGAMKHGSQEFYHSGTDKAFGYTQNKNASNLMFFKKEGSSIPSEPTADGTVFNLENSSVSNFLTEAASRYTDENWSSKSVVTDYCKSGWGNSYTADNREDIPAPVTITWSNQASGTKTLTVYNDSNRTDIETSVTTTSTSAEIYNLIPGRTYYYTVSTTGNSNIASGYFKTEGRRRMMLVGNKSDFGQNYANNCRDFGGLTTTNGKTVKYNKIFRGSNMDDTSSDQKSYLKGYMSIDLDVDLRGNSGNPLGVTLSNQYYNSWDNLSDPTRMKATLNDIFTAVKDNKTIYIHCLVGADRTGYVCMLLQALLGVSEKDCSIDYELTSFSTIGVRARSGQGNVYFTQGMNHIEGQDGDTFQQKAVNYVKSLGFTDSDIQTFQDNMLQ